MGNYLGAWDSMLDRWNAIWSNEIVLTTEHAAIAFGQPMNKYDGLGMSWDAERRSVLNKLQFCSMVGHDADVRVFLFPVIEERLRVIIERFLRAECEVEATDRLDFLRWNDQQFFDIWALWRMCSDQSYTYATSRVEILTNFGLCGDQGDGATLMDLFYGNRQMELASTSGITYEAIGFIEFANRLYGHMYMTDEMSPTTAFIKDLLIDYDYRRFGVPYRVKARFWYW